MAHKADGGFFIVIGGDGCSQGIGNDLEILIRGQQRGTNGKGKESILIPVGFCHQLLILKAIHDMRWLNDQVFHAIGYGPIQSLGNIVDGDPVPTLNVVNDHLAGKAPAKIISRKGPFQSILDGSDGQPAAVKIAGAKADHQKLLFSDTILVSGVIRLMGCLWVHWCFLLRFAM